MTEQQAFIEAISQEYPTPTEAEVASFVEEIDGSASDVREHQQRRLNDAFDKVGEAMAPLNARTPATRFSGAIDPVPATRSTGRVRSQSGPPQYVPEKLTESKSEARTMMLEEYSPIGSV